MKYEFELHGEIPSKKNLLMINKGRVFLRKSEEIESITYDLMSQKKKYKNLPIKEDVCLSVELSGSRRRDFLNEISTIADCLQDAKIIENDRQIMNISNCVKTKGKTYCHIILSML